MSRRSIAAIAVGAFVVLVGVVVWYGWLRSPRLDDLQTATKRFSPPPDWVLEDSRSRDRGPLCIDVECPSLSRRWSSSTPISNETLERMMTDAGWRDVAIEQVCPGFAVVAGSAQTTCTGQASANGYAVALGVSGPHHLDSKPGETYSFSLSVEP